VTNERPDWDAQFAEDDDERRERWRRIKARRYRDALEAVLLFHSASPWTPEKQARWAKLTGEAEATTRALCDAVRRALG
jgi:hypothetical protein